MLRLCPNRDHIWISDGGVRTDFGFSFDAAPTIDTVLYFRIETKEDRVDLIDTSSSRTS